MLKLAVGSHNFCKGSMRDFGVTDGLTHGVFVRC